MVCASACLPQGSISFAVTTLHPIQRDGDGGFFLPIIPLPGATLSPSIARQVRKDSVNGRCS